MSQLRKWRNNLAPHVVLEMAPHMTCELQEGETHREAVAQVRAEIAAVSLEVIRTKNAPLPKEHLKAGAREHVTARAAAGRLGHIEVERGGQFRVQWPECDFGAAQETACGWSRLSRARSTPVAR